MEVCGKCQDPWNDDVSSGDMALSELEYCEKALVCPSCCDNACWFCGSKEEVRYRLCGRCSLEYDVDGICAGCKTVKRKLNEDGVCLECSAGVKSSKRIATHQHADKRETSIHDEKEFRREVLRRATEDHAVDSATARRNWKAAN